MRWNAIDWVATALTIVGAVNWGLVGLFKFDLVATLFGDMSALARIVYSLVGLAGLWLVWFGIRAARPATVEVRAR